MVSCARVDGFGVYWFTVFAFSALGFKGFRV